MGIAALSRPLYRFWVKNHVRLLSLVIAGGCDYSVSSCHRHCLLAGLRRYRGWRDLNADRNFGTKEVFAVFLWSDISRYLGGGKQTRRIREWHCCCAVCLVGQRGMVRTFRWKSCDVLANEICETKGLVRIEWSEGPQNSGYGSEATIETFVYLARHGRRALGRKFHCHPTAANVA